MSHATLAYALYEFLWDAAIIVSVPLLAATILGVTVGLFQAVTQLQEQTLPQSVKLVVIGFVLMVFGGALCAPLYGSSRNLFDTFHLIRSH